MNAQEARQMATTNRRLSDDAAERLAEIEADLNIKLQERDAYVADIMEKAKRQVAELKAFYAEDIHLLRMSRRSWKKAANATAESADAWERTATILEYPDD